MRTGCRTSGFALAEMIIVLVVSTVILGALLAGMVALVHGLQPRRLVLRGEELPVAPTFGAFPSAVRLHQTLTERIASARAVYVLGGRHLSIPADASPALVRPLRIQALPSLAAAGMELPADAAGFYARFSTVLGEQEPTSHPDDFTVVVIGPVDGGLDVTCLAQVRRKEVSVNDGGGAVAFAVREVRLWDVDGASLRYAFAERCAPAPNLFVGAVHTWMRFRSGAVAEEGPACVVFPDPWVYAGARGRPDDVPGFSRFSYFLAVSR